MNARGIEINKGILILVVIVVFLALVGVFLYIQVRVDPVAQAIEAQEPIKILFLVEDAEQLLFTELFIYHPLTGRGALLDIPGNTGLILPSVRRMDRIDYLYDNEGFAAFKRMVEEFVGFPIPFYVRMPYEHVADLVDLLEGIELFIPDAVDLASESGDERFLLPQGTIRLDGSKIDEYLRFRLLDESSVTIVNRQQRFIQALLHRMGQMNAFLNHASVRPFLSRFLDTNIDGKGLQTLVTELSRFQSDNVVYQRTLGTQRVVDGQTLLFPEGDGDLVRDTLANVIFALAELQGTARTGASIRVQILNGTDVRGLARRTADLFENRGLTLSVGNAERSTQETTVVIDRRGDIEAARRVAEVIRCTRVYTELGAPGDGTPDITLILGRDFDGTYCRD